MGYEVKLIEQPTGRVHNVVGAGVQPILDETTGEPETEYVLVAVIGDSQVPLETYTKGYIDHQVGRPDTTVEADDSSSSSSATPTGEAPIGEPEKPEQPQT